MVIYESTIVLVGGVTYYTRVPKALVDSGILHHKKKYRIQILGEVEE